MLTKAQAIKRAIDSAITAVDPLQDPVHAQQVINFHRQMLRDSLEGERATRWMSAALDAYDSYVEDKLLPAPWSLWLVCVLYPIFDPDDKHDMEVYRVGAPTQGYAVRKVRAHFKELVDSQLLDPGAVGEIVKCTELHPVDWVAVDRVVSISPQVAEKYKPLEI